MKRTHDSIIHFMTTGILCAAALVMIFAGAGLKPRRIYREIKTVDVATTLSAFIGTKPPSGSQGQILKEVVR